MPVRYPEAAGKPYRPSNGTEGDMFTSKWCEQCSKHDFDNDDGPVCGILFGMLNNYHDDPAYPKQICLDENGTPQCTEFEAQVEQKEASKEVKKNRCKNTPDLFGGAA